MKKIQNLNEIFALLNLSRGHRCTQGGGGGGAPHVPPIKIFEKLPHKNAIKHDPPDFLTTPSTPIKRICQKNQGPPPWISNYCESMVGVLKLTISFCHGNQIQELFFHFILL
jgi:hypothetical protein